MFVAGTHPPYSEEQVEDAWHRIARIAGANRLYDDRLAIVSGSPRGYEAPTWVDWAPLRDWLTSSGLLARENARELRAESVRSSGCDGPRSGGPAEAPALRQPKPTTQCPQPLVVVLRDLRQRCRARRLPAMLTPSTRRLATWSTALRARRPLYAVPVFVLTVPPQTVQRYRQRRPHFVGNEPWPTMLRPSFPRLSHPRLAQAIPSIACIAHVYLGGTRGFRPRSRR